MRKLLSDQAWGKVQGCHITKSHLMGQLGLEQEASLCPALIMKFSKRAVMYPVYKMCFPVPLIQDVTQGNPQLKNSV